MGSVDTWNGSWGVSWALSWTQPETLPPVKVGGSGKTKHYWELEQESQRKLTHERVHDGVGTTEEFVLQEYGEGSLISARIELEKARQELETRRRIEKDRALRKSKNTQIRIFADRQAEEAHTKRVNNLVQEGFDEDEAIFLMEATDDA